MRNNCHKILCHYDKFDNLIDYVEFTDDREHVKCSFFVDGNMVKKTYLQDFRNDEEPYIENLKGIVEYSDSVVLFPLVLNGETYVQIKYREDKGLYTNPVILNKFFSCQPQYSKSSSVDTFSIKSNLIDEYLNKL